MTNAKARIDRRIMESLYRANAGIEPIHYHPNDLRLQQEQDEKKQRQEDNDNQIDWFNTTGIE